MNHRDEAIPSADRSDVVDGNYFLFELSAEVPTYFDSPNHANNVIVMIFQDVYFVLGVFLLWVGKVRIVWISFLRLQDQQKHLSDVCEPNFRGDGASQVWIMLDCGR